MSRPTSPQDGPRQPRPPHTDPRPLLTQAEAARLLGLDQCNKRPELAVWRMIRRGELQGVRIGHRWMVTPESVDQLRYGE